MRGLGGVVGGVGAVANSFGRFVEECVKIEHCERFLFKQLRGSRSVASQDSTRAQDGTYSLFMASERGRLRSSCKKRVS